MKSPLPPALVLAATLAGSACRPGAEQAKPTADAVPDASPAAKEARPIAHKIKRLEPSPAPTGAVVTLGRALFFDERLSAKNDISCATCHDPDKAFADALRVGKGQQGKALARNTPSVVNVDARAPFFWDGRAPTAEEQALGPITSTDEMAQDLGELVKELEEVPEYVARFEAAFGSPGIDKERIGKALATFERTLISADAPIDRYLGADHGALSPEAARGFALFTGKAECVKCHDGPHFTDASFHNIGVKGGDLGRFQVLAVPVLKGAFKTPGLRDVDLTAPYFHDGSAENLDQDIHRLGLTAAEKGDLVAFMRALTGKPLTIERPRLPRVNRTPRRISTLTLMKDVDGMLASLDRLVARLDEGEWDEARATVNRLIGNTEELAALRSRLVPKERLPLLRLRIGALVVAFDDLERAIGRRERAAAMTAYDGVRDRCEQCHDDFRGQRR